jgi:hypothetical protein
MTSDFENPQKPNPTAQSGEFSVFQEQYEKEKSKIEGLDSLIRERLKFLRFQTDPQIIERTKREIGLLREERADALSGAFEAMEKHRSATDKLLDFDPSDKKTGGRA